MTRITGGPTGPLQERESSMSDAKAKAVELGVRDAFDFWLSQHEISFPALCEDAIQNTLSEWLDAHEDEIIAAIASQGRSQ